MALNGFGKSGPVLHHPLHVGAMGPTPIIEIGRAAIEIDAATTGDGTENCIGALTGEHGSGNGVKRRSTSGSFQSGTVQNSMSSPADGTLGIIVW
jgi:hypothetical protein